jgi:hypothetical protein
MGRGGPCASEWEHRARRARADGQLGRAGSYKREKIIGHRREDPIRTADP